MESFNNLNPKIISHIVVSIVILLVTLAIIIGTIDNEKIKLILELITIILTGGYLINRNIKNNA